MLANLTRSRLSAVVTSVVMGALVWGALTAAAASAHSLVLKAEGVLVPVGSTSFVEMTINVQGNASNCDFGSYDGRLLSNSAPKDAISDSLPVELNHCSAGTSIAGTITQVRITSKGKLKITANPKLALTIPGECTYETGKLTATFPVPGTAFSPEISGKAKASKTSAASCAKSARIEGGVAVGLNEPPRFADFELSAM